MKPKFAILAVLAIVAISFLPVHQANAWANVALPTCNDSLQRLDIRTLFENFQPSYDLNDSTRIVVGMTSTTSLLIIVYPSSSTADPLFQYYPSPSSPQTPREIRYTINAPGVAKILISGSYNGSKFYSMSSSTSTTLVSNAERNFTCIQYANNIGYSTNWGTGGIPQFPTRPISPVAGDTYNQTYQITNTTTSGTPTDKPVSSPAWYNPAILFGHDLDSLNASETTKVFYQSFMAVAVLTAGVVILYFVFKVLVWFLPNFWKRGKE